MNTVYISIEKDIGVFEQFKKLWDSRGITGIRVGTMMEGIKTAAAIKKSNDKCLYFIDIVADDINFLPLLPLLEEAGTVPILIVVSKDRYSEEEHHMALNNGAFFYGPYCDDPEKNINGVVAIVDSYRRVAKKQKTHPDILSRGGVLISISRRKAYVHDLPVDLTPQEFDVLHILMLNAGKVLRHDEIYRHIHDGEYDDNTAKSIIYSITARLRRKLQKSTDCAYIQSAYDVGYAFSLDDQ